MKNAIKVALGIVAGGSLVYLAKKIKQRKEKENLFTAPDGNTYKENQTYRTADGEVFKNGKKVHIQVPTDSGNHQNRVDPGFNNQHLNEKANLPKPEVAYHQRGDRHR
ncbi:hypothetical protein IX39_10625 [Chryseobacterium formosense]|uniref:Uncharacterized protein n=1 Tax=Chryseobacterium formosense TaxID=236814 RepID=A0A085Z9D2_9FLAO|nr:hypothetical protein [Chryseobacterium formosense]KFF01046.1 hypothetical protein IX39_10625 [Chryseobacterium formosense]SFT41313.1 hypothetical protein SAMN05421857_0819 [Chryseobacterium formosense]